MELVSKALAMLLLATVAAASVPVQALATPAGPRPRLGGCHEPAPTVPAPAPANYKCCVAGHGSAIVQESAVPRPVHLHVGLAPQFIPAAAPVAGDTSLHAPLPLSGDPPGLTPLRI